ncbi:vesicular mannose-binding lectin [Anaeramoeba flamelloides]|uniref:Vesicular mannose-binding lectin n=1 Tax=Anaeramoeba flamelloides TaxID=1746091 RepID=A0ABQ8X7C7_9EUKA|nr:vesicular mannose-binding lectin [Anaeramoeba flamelloides]
MSSKILLLFLSCLLLCHFSQTNRAYKPIQQHYSFFPPFYEQLSHWDFTGSAKSFQDYIQLTNDERHQQGLIFHKTATNFKYWEAEIEFKIHGSTDDGADGMAFWYTKERNEIGPVFGSKNQFNGLGIFLDTHDNDRNKNNPFVQAMIGDGKKAYDANLDGSTTSAGQCSAEFRNSDQKTKLLITYLDETLTVKINFHGRKSYSNCIYLENIQLPTGYYFGLSAATGLLYDNHEIHKFIVKDLTPNESDKMYSEIYEEDSSKTEEKEKIFIKYKELEQYLRKLINEKQYLIDLENKNQQEAEEEIYQYFLKITDQYDQLSSKLTNLLEFVDFHSRNQPSVTSIHLYLRDLDTTILENSEDITMIVKQTEKMSNFFNNDVIKKNQNFKDNLDQFVQEANDLQNVVQHMIDEQELLETDIRRETGNINSNITKKKYLTFWIFFFLCQIIFLIFIWYWRNEEKQKKKVL